MTLQEFYSVHHRITRSLRNFISDHQSKLAENDFPRFLNSLSEELHRLKGIVFQAPSGPLRAKLVQALVEHEIEKEKSIASTCAKGCSHCCHLEVEITSDEAKILKEVFAKKFSSDLVRRTEHLRMQSQRALQDPAWRDQRQRANNRCVFLGEDEACSIYEDRPVMCRRHSVTSAPSLCETWDENITLRYFPRVDLIISAANEDPNLSVGPMGKMLTVS